MDASANALIAMSPTSSQPLFVFLTSLNALTSGGHPALQSLGAVSLRAMGKGNEIGLVFGALGLSNAVSHIVAVRPIQCFLHHCLAHICALVCPQPGTYAAIYGATVAAFPKAMFVTSAALLYIAVFLLARIQPNIHIPPAELEETIIVPASEEVEDAGEGPYVQARNRSRNSAAESEALQRVSATFLSHPED
jgi:hypothetical protein